MPIAYNIEKTTEKGKPIKIERKKDKKLVKGWKVDWVDAKGEVHHDGVEIYTRGQNKGKPKSTLRGALTKNFAARAVDLPTARRMVELGTAKKKAKSSAKRKFATQLEGKLRAEFPKGKLYSGIKHVTINNPKYYGGNAYKKAMEEFANFNKNYTPANDLIDKFLSKYKDDDNDKGYAPFRAKKKFYDMTREEQIRHATKVIKYLKPAIIPKLKADAKRRYSQDPARMKRSVDTAILFNYNRLSKAIKSNFEP